MNSVESSNTEDITVLACGKPEVHVSPAAGCSGWRPVFTDHDWHFIWSVTDKRAAVQGKRGELWPSYLGGMRIPTI